MYNILQQALDVILLRVFIVRFKMLQLYTVEAIQVPWAFKEDVYYFSKCMMHLCGHAHFRAQVLQSENNFVELLLSLREF